MCHYRFYYSAHRGIVLIELLPNRLWPIVYGINFWPPEAKIFAVKQNPTGVRKNLSKLILRKCEKDKSPHWSCCFVIVSFIAVALLVAATGVWIVGLIQLDMYRESYFRSNNIWAKVGLFFTFFCFFTSGNHGRFSWFQIMNRLKRLISQFKLVQALWSKRFHISRTLDIDPEWREETRQIFFESSLNEIECFIKSVHLTQTRLHIPRIKLSLITWEFKWWI